MSSNILRQLWSAIEETQSRTLLQLNDAELIDQLLTQMNRQRELDREETDAIKSYLQSKLLLIRDMVC